MTDAIHGIARFRKLGELLMQRADTLQNEGAIEDPVGRSIWEVGASLCNECDHLEQGGRGAPQALLDVIAERLKQDERFGNVTERQMWLRMGEAGAVVAAVRSMVLAPDAKSIEDRAKYVCEHVLRGTHAEFWGVLFEEVFEALAAPTPADLRGELVQVAAVALFGVESLDAGDG